MAKELLRIIIYEDINKPHTIVINGETHYTITQTVLYEAIRESIRVRLETNQEKIFEQMKNKGALTK